jgi:hypothetical protein
VAETQAGKALGLLKANNGKKIFGESANGGGELQSTCLGHVFGS